MIAERVRGRTLNDNAIPRGAVITFADDPRLAAETIHVPSPRERDQGSLEATSEEKA